MKLNNLFLSCILLTLVIGCDNRHKTEYTPPVTEQSEPQVAVAITPEPQVEATRLIYRISSPTGHWTTDSSITVEDNCAKFTVNDKLVYTCGNYSIEEQ